MEGKVDSDTIVFPANLAPRRSRSGPPPLDGALSTSHPIPNGAMVVAQALFFPAPSLAVPYEDKLARVDPSSPITDVALLLGAFVPPSFARRKAYFQNRKKKTKQRTHLPPPRSVSDPLLSSTPDAVLRALSSVRLPQDVGRGFDRIPTSDRHQRMLNSQACDEACGMVAQIVRGTLL
ncbi:hypothetical protein DFH11DRAFT_1810581 [Phellopilus nigrolimitatus]|nr:hypothetical protein DFH11DRAFT_1810581 [Phellopilus nigrolimitatus]